MKKKKILSVIKSKNNYNIVKTQQQPNNRSMPSSVIKW